MIRKQAISPERKHFLKELIDLRVPLDIVIFDVEGAANLDGDRACQEAAIEGMKTILLRNYADLDRLHQQAEIQKMYQAKIYGGPIGKRITIEKLLGPFYTIENRVVRRAALELKEIRAWEKLHGPKEGGAIRFGFVDAMLTPPYGIALEADDWEGREALVGRFLLQFLRYDAMTGTLAEPLHTMSWSTDWCTYFDVGNEWWGSFLWTILLRDRAEIVVIGASASD